MAVIMKTKGYNKFRNDFMLKFLRLSRLILETIIGISIVTVLYASIELLKIAIK